jgi:hypothetical protein
MKKVKETVRKVIMLDKFNRKSLENYSFFEYEKTEKEEDYRVITLKLKNDEKLEVKILSLPTGCRFWTTNITTGEEFKESFMRGYDLETIVKAIAGLLGITEIGPGPKNIDAPNVEAYKRGDYGPYGSDEALKKLWNVRHKNFDVYGSFSLDLR